MVVKQKKGKSQCGRCTAAGSGQEVAHYNYARSSFMDRRKKRLCKKRASCCVAHYSGVRVVCPL